MTTYGAYAEGRVKVGPAPSSGGKMGYFAAAKLIGGGIILVVILGVCGHYVYTYKHNQTVIAQQQAKIDGLQAEKEVQAKKNKNFEDFMSKHYKVIQG